MFASKNHLSFGFLVKSCELCCKFGFNRKNCGINTGNRYFGFIIICRQMK